MANDELHSKAAAAYLGVKTSTLYAYVSRGLIESFRRPGEPRRRYYKRSDLDRLKRRSDAHSGHGAAAAAALDWGSPVLDTSITEITAVGPVYRGRAARELARSERFEDVAQWLWSAPSDGGWDPLESAPEFRPDRPPLDRMRLALMMAEVDDPLRFSTAPEAQRRVARRIVQTLAHAWCGRHPARIGEVFVTADPNTALDAALIALADHELNASTFAARVAASTGANLWACASAGFATLTGPKHGGSAQRCELLVGEVVGASSANQVLSNRMRRGEHIPGFDHPLYPEGDPRWAMIVSRLDARASTEVIEAVDDLVEAAAELELGKPTVDLALASLCAAFGMEEGSSAAIFALGRSAGWIAHSLEQYEQGNLLRPRARFQPK